MTAITNAGAQRFFRNGLLSATTYAGLHTDAPGSDNELAGTGYARLTLLRTRWDITDNVGELNADLEWSDEAMADWGDPTHVGLWTAANGGDLLIYGSLSVDVPAVTTGSRVFVEGGDLDVTIPTGDLTNEGANLGLTTGLLAASVYGGLHTADPTAMNELSGSDYSRLTLATSRWDFANNTASLNADLEWEDNAAESWGDPTHVGLWSASGRGAGDLLVKGDISTDVPPITEGTRVTVRTGAFVLTLPLAA